MIPFSFIQKGLMYDVLTIGDDVPIYNNGGMVEMRGFVDCDVLEKAVRLSIKRSRILGSVIVEKDGEAYFEDGHFDAPVIDYTDFSDAPDPVAEAHFYCRKSVSAPFGDLKNKPLCRFTVLKITEDRYALHMKYHQIINDGWGIVRHLTDVVECYSAVLNGKTDELPEMNDYGDFQTAHAEYINSEKFAKDLRFMTSYYNDDHRKIFVSEMHGTKDDFLSQESDYVFPLEFLNRLKSRASSSGVSLTNILYVCTYLAVYKFFGVKDQLYSYINLNRRGHIQKDTVGSFVNVLAMKSGWGADLSMKELGFKFARESMRLMRHTACPSVFVSSELTKLGKKGRHIGEISVNHITPKPPQKMQGADVNIIYTPSGYCGYPLDVVLMETAENRDVLLRTVKKETSCLNQATALTDACGAC